MNRGLLPLSQGTTDTSKYMRSDGTWAAPSGSGLMPFPHTVGWLNPAAMDGDGSGTASRVNFDVNIGASAPCTKIAAQCGTSSGNVDFGIYAPTVTQGGTVPAAGKTIPGVRKVSTGSIACPAAGYVEFTIAQTLIATGDYFAWNADNTTAQFLRAANGYASQAALVTNLMDYMDNNFPLPAMVNDSSGLRATAGSGGQANGFRRYCMKGLP